jgi:hypothetical protein
MTDRPLAYIDYQRFSDGSEQWVWLIHYKDRLWRAGVSKSIGGAMLRAHLAWYALAMTLPERERQRLGDPSEDVLVDLDQVERGPVPEPDPAA